MAQLSLCPSFGDPRLNLMSEDIGRWATKNLEKTFDKREGALQRGREARIALWMIVSLETLWDGARKCPGGNPQKTAFLEAQDTPDQANFATYALFVIDALTLFLTELEGKTVWPYFAAHGLEPERDSNIPSVEDVISTLITLKTLTIPIHLSPTTFSPSSYQPHVGRVLETLVPLFHAHLVVLDPARVEQALDVQARMDLNEKFGEWWGERVLEQDGAAQTTEPIWIINDLGQEEFPPHSSSSTKPFFTKAKTVVHDRNKHRKIWDRYGRYPSKLGVGKRTGVGKMFGAQGILAGGTGRA